MSKRVCECVGGWMSAWLENGRGPGEWALECEKAQGHTEAI